MFSIAIYAIIGKIHFKLEKSNHSYPEYIFEPGLWFTGELGS
jgi:hypothetical protein